MEIILKEDVASIGRAGDKVDVKPGYARNYLIPKGLALEVTAGNIKLIEAQKSKRQKKEQEEKAAAESVAAKLANISCTITVNAGEDDKLFGSVTHSDVAHVLAAEGVAVDKKDIVFEEEITKLGIYYCKIKLHPQVTQRVKLWIVKK
ncbi:MAG: 50S ribosomal protein L9 [Candidatus Omnitrophica bacterium]|jgi:large subunit ribosomal protein L9|nr:50S ribosomal protein L9 [Candidatus Omnitrophota bacterium]